MNAIYKSVAFQHSNQYIIVIKNNVDIVLNMWINSVFNYTLYNSQQS